LCFVIIVIISTWSAATHGSRFGCLIIHHQLLLRQLKYPAHHAWIPSYKNSFSL
jgi:hypothetical protein